MKRFLLALVAFFFCAMAWAGDVCVVAKEAGYYTSLARHVARWLKGEGIPAEIADAKGLSSALATAKIAFLIGYDEPSAADMNAIAAYKNRGGKLVVFYSSSPALSRLMGVKVLGYAKASYPGQWSCMDFNAKFPAGLPRSIRQTSTVLQRAEPLPGKGRVIATWSDRARRSTGDAAWISTAAGYWMTHVLLADGDEDLKAQLLASLVGAIVPRLWNATDAAARKSREIAALSSFASRQTPRRGEIHAVWDHTGCGLYPGDWPRTVKVLKDAGVSDLFLNVAGAAFAHYPSDVLPRSKIFEQEGDQLKACLAAAAGSGIRVHAWILCFNATRGTPERLEKFKQKGWRLKTRNGGLSEYLDPANPDVRNHIYKAIDEIQAKYNVSGIHLDFVRWYERAVKPANATSVISKFVAGARARVKKSKWFTVAVLGKYPACVASVGQDWPGWLDSHIVDYVVPMDYTEDNVKFESFVAQHASLKKHAPRTIAGIGITANESRLDARKAIEQILIARKYGLAGVALFDLDATLEKNILPYLKLGAWK